MPSLAEMRQSTLNLLKENEKVAVLNDAINSGIQDLYRNLMQINLSMFLNGPTNITLAAGTERSSIVSIPDPAGPPVTGSVAGGALAARDYSISFSYVTDSGSETLESAASSAQHVNLNNLATVTAPAFVDGAAGWNLYARINVGRKARQNVVPLPFDVTINEPEVGWKELPNLPGAPVENTTADNIAYIRHLELVLGDGRLKRYSQADIDSLLMQRAGSSIASTSEYQSYAYDFVNQNRVEVRPKMGTTLTPRYFWVTRPRRLRYDQSPIPFYTFDPTDYLTYNAMSIISLTNHEYVAAQLWNDKADKTMFGIKQSINQGNFAKDIRVTPYLR